MMTTSTTNGQAARLTPSSDVNATSGDTQIARAVENQSRTVKNQYKEVDETVRVTASALNVRQQPTVTSGVVRKVFQGDTLDICAHVYGFGHLSDKTGYVALDYTEVVSGGSSNGEDSGDGESGGGSEGEGGGNTGGQEGGGTGEGNENPGGSGEPDGEGTGSGGTDPGNTPSEGDGTTECGCNCDCCEGCEKCNPTH